MTYRGDGCADKPKNEQDEEADHFSQEAREDAVLEHAAREEDVQPACGKYTLRSETGQTYAKRDHSRERIDEASNSATMGS